ncbi:MAG TPA: isochorismate synthase [Polyangiaceae bacterium]|nr:isochorismate synthase [Polyangiaceae bacterium]
MTQSPVSRAAYCADGPQPGSRGDHPRQGSVAGNSDSLRGCLEAARAQSSAGADDFVWVQIDAPRASPEALLQRFPEQDSVLWSAPDGQQFAGIGVAQSVSGRGPRRFSELRRRTGELWSRLRAPGIARGALEAPRLFGGFSFSARAESESAWSDFGAARLVLPRITYGIERGRAVLGLAIERSELDRAGASEHVQLLEQVYQAVLGQPVLDPGQPAAPHREQANAEEFRQRVDAAVAAIGAGSLQKVVAAREVLLDFPCRIDPVATVSALAEQAPECQRFLFRWGASAFLGATPERLVRKRARSLETEALAGSIEAGPDSPERQLEANLKELEEHELVVSAIQRALDPVCEQVQLPGRPGVRRLKHLLHLRTPIQATLRAETHVLEIVERLHPTPAVGGVPTAASLDWIARHEPFDRGWYAGPVGWCDAFGDGEFNVALRSGFVRSQQARLYAGCGIVRGSVAAAEYAETTWKLAPVLSSLRARP